MTLDGVVQIPPLTLRSVSFCLIRSGIDSSVNDFAKVNKRKVICDGLRLEPGKNASKVSHLLSKTSLLRNRRRAEDVPKPSSSNDYMHSSLDRVEQRLYVAFCFQQRVREGDGRIREEVYSSR
jgi:hypothetical protein